MSKLVCPKCFSPKLRRLSERNMFYCYGHFAEVFIGQTYRKLERSFALPGGISEIEGVKPIPTKIYSIRSAYKK